MLNPNEDDMGKYREPVQIISSKADSPICAKIKFLGQLLGQGGTLNFHLKNALAWLPDCVDYS